MIYKFFFTKKPFSSLIAGQVETNNFNKWFMEHAPYGVRLAGKPDLLKEREGGGY